MVTRNLERTMENKLARLWEIQRDIHAVDAALSLASWDQMVYMPLGGVEDRGNMVYALAKMHHQKSTTDELGRILDDLTAYSASLDPDSVDACLVKQAKRTYDKNSRIPTEFVAEFSQVTARAQSAWEKAKDESQFTIFQPHLEEIVRHLRRYAEFFSPYDHIYDPLLDDNEPGLKTTDVQTLFDTARPAQIALIEKIKECEQPEAPFLQHFYDTNKQLDFIRSVITSLNFDWNRGRLDFSTHPFTTSFGLGDVRITTHLRENDLAAGLFGAIHETGHALYEQGFSPVLADTLLANGASGAVHESQSRLYENIIGRSLSFWQYYYPLLQSKFPGQLGEVEINDFYRGINLVMPSLIRIFADEATYNLHIFLRMELEISLLDGSFSVEDLPEAWNAKMKQYLGITPETDEQGVLQDIHWSLGSFGGFPAYALGNFISAHLWQKMNVDLPGLDEQFLHGKFDDALGWLRKNVHTNGAKYQPQQLVENVCGTKIEAQPYLDYLTMKYSEIYRLV